MEAGSLFFKLAALCAFYFAIVQFIQSRLTPGIPRGSGFEDSLASEMHPLSIVRYRLVLSSIFLLVFAFGGIMIAKWTETPLLAIFGFVFSLLFVVCEVVYRSIELFGVINVLMPAYLSETDPTAKAAKRAVIEGFNTSVTAVYFPLLLGHLVAAVLFGLALVDDGGLATLAGIALFVNALRLLIRILAMHGGVSILGLLSRRIYYPVVISTFALVGAWLWTL